MSEVYFKNRSKTFEDIIGDKINDSLTDTYFNSKPSRMYDTDTKTYEDFLNDILNEED